MTQNQLTLKQVGFRYKTDFLFQNLNLSLKAGQKIALVGSNGSGKTTLLKLMAGELEIDEGEILKPNSLKISYLPQDFEYLHPQKTIQEFLLPFQGQNLEDYLHRENLLEKYKPFFSLKNFNQKIQHLSGGQQRQVAILKTLLADGDLLLLDEPTNHLDLISLKNLKNLILSLDKTVLLISHDRYFVDQTVEAIWEVNEGKVFNHTGNYSDYLHSKEKRYQMLLKQYEKRAGELKRELEWVNSGVKARGTKDQGRLNRYYELKEKHKNSKPKWQKPFLPLPKMRPLGNKILKLKEVSVKFIDSNEKLIENLNLEFKAGAKIGLIGPNGAGKTSLIQALLEQSSQNVEVLSSSVADDKNPRNQRFRPLATSAVRTCSKRPLGHDGRGAISIGQNTFFNYQDQKRLKINDDWTLKYALSQNNLQLKFGDSTINVYAYAKKFLFTSHDLDKTMGSLSGGQKARLILALILKKGGNFLILDEPTNDLDLDLLEALENSLIDFKGCLIVVSHDRFFLDRVCNQILALEGKGKYVLSTGNYTDYLQKYGRQSDFYRQFVEENYPPAPLKPPKNQRFSGTRKGGGLYPTATSTQVQSQPVPNNFEVIRKGGKNNLSFFKTPSTQNNTNQASDAKIKSNPYTFDPFSNPYQISAKQKRQQKVKLRNLEKEIKTQEKQIFELETELNDSKLYQKTREEIQKLIKLLEEKRKGLETLEGKWLEMSEL